MNYALPTEVEIEGNVYPIRSDYRVILDIFEAFGDPNLNNDQKALAALDIFYPGFLTIPGDLLQEAAERLLWFINCGNEGDSRKRPKLMDWEQDFLYIAAPINRVVGQEIRSMPYLHWWTFIAAYYEIGDCFFAQIVRIRSLRAKGKRLEKADQEFYRENKCLVNIKERYSEAENTLLQEWI